MTISSAMAYTTEFPTHYNLWEGSAALHEIEVSGSCNTQVSIVSPYEASFDLYAVNTNGTPGICSSNRDIMTHYDKVSMSKRGRASLILEKGHWCVVVYARLGNGSVYMTSDSNCDSGVQNPTIESNSAPYNSPRLSGYL
jgi:hypothetical protein